MCDQWVHRGWTSPPDRYRCSVHVDCSVPYHVTLIQTRKWHITTWGKWTTLQSWGPLCCCRSPLTTTSLNANLRHDRRFLYEENPYFCLILPHGEPPWLVWPASSDYDWDIWLAPLSKCLMRTAWENGWLNSPLTAQVGELWRAKGWLSLGCSAVPLLPLCDLDTHHSEYPLLGMVLGYKMGSWLPKDWLFRASINLGISFIHLSDHSSKRWFLMPTGWVCLLPSRDSSSPWENPYKQNFISQVQWRVVRQEEITQTLKRWWRDGLSLRRT